MQAFPAFSDPEGWYYWALGASMAQQPELAFGLLERGVSTGFHCPRALEINPLLDSLRGSERFARILATARAAHDEAIIEFSKADGHRLLGLSAV